jgi:phosphoglycolate phosphatase-like HAD superfamily hydrolase
MKAVLFDVDGTLVDTNYLHTVCWWEALRAAGRTVPMVDIRAAIGMGSDQLLPHLLGEQPDDADALEERHAELIRAYWDRLCPTNRAGDLVRACAERGARVVLASSAGGDELTALRRAIDADAAIAAATSKDDVSTSKPAPDLVERALELAGASADEAVFVGDSVWDVAAAHRAGVVCVALTCGGTTDADLLAAGAEEVYADPAELLAKLRSSALSRLGCGRRPAATSSDLR